MDLKVEKICPDITVFLLHAIITQIISEFDLNPIPAFPCDGNRSIG
jgi:hypothetical protein